MRITPDRDSTKEPVRLSKTFDISSVIQATIPGHTTTRNVNGCFQLKRRLRSRGSITIERGYGILIHEYPIELVLPFPQS